MKDYARDIWKEYHNHAPFWLNHLMPPKTIGALVHDLNPLIPPDPVVILSSEAIFSDKSPASIVPYYSSDASQEYMGDTSKCTPSPWVYRTERGLADVDFHWFEIILKDRTKNWPKIRKDLLDGAVEMKQVKPCFDATELIRFSNGYFAKDVDDVIGSVDVTVRDLVGLQAL